MTAGRSGSARLRAIQTAQLLRRLGVDATLRHPAAPPHAWDDLRDATVVFVKLLHVGVALRLRDRGNRIALDWIDPHHDTCVRSDGTQGVLDAAHTELLDGLLCVNRSMLARAQAEGLARGALRRWIPHTWDLRCRRYLPRRDRFSLVFFGHSGVRLAANEAHQILLERHRASLLHFVRLSRFTCHLAVRDRTGAMEAETQGVPALAYASKSNIKLSTAAALGANIVATPDPGIVDLLDEDYPYLANGPSESEKVIERARHEYGGAIWRRGLEQMREVRERTRPLRIAEEYRSFLSALGGWSG